MSHNAGNPEEKTLRDFLTPTLLQNIKKLKGVTLKTKNRKKSHKAEKRGQYHTVYGQKDLHTYQLFSNNDLKDRTKTKTTN